MPLCEKERGLFCILVKLHYDPIPIGGTISDPTYWMSHQARSQTCAHTYVAQNGPKLG